MTGDRFAGGDDRVDIGCVLAADLDQTKLIQASSGIIRGIPDNGP